MAIPASDVDRRIAELGDLARNLDSRWRIPGTGIRFGLDAVAGLLPGVGDVASGLVSAHIVYHVGRMIANVALDTVVGSVPILGSVFDVFYKANNRNVRMLQRHLESARG